MCGKWSRTPPRVSREPFKPIKDDILAPEHATLMEWFMQLFHLPYVWGCVLVAAFVGAPGELFSLYLDKSNLQDTYGLFIGNAIAPTPISQIFASNTIFSMVIFYVLYMIRHVRLKVVAAEKELLPLLPNGEESFHKVFGRISSLRHPMVLSVLLGIPFVLYFIPFFQSYSFFGLVYLAVSISLSLAMSGTFIWVYLISLWGLHKLGGEPLKLKPYVEDAKFGLKPIGSLSLSLAIAYFGGLGFGSLYLFITPNPALRASQVVAMVFALVLAGAVLTFLPLKSVHRRMSQELQHESIPSRLVPILKESKKPDWENSQATVGELRGIFRERKNVLTVDIAKRKVAAAWPFDAGTLGKFIAIMVTVGSSPLIGRVITVMLRN